MVLTALVLIAGYGAVLAAHLEEPSRKGTPSTTTPVETLPIPNDAPDLHTPANDELDLAARPTGTSSVEVSGEEPGGPGLSIAVFDQESGALLAAKELNGSRLPQVLAFTLPVGQHPVYLTREVPRARISYIDRAILEVSTGEGTAATSTSLSNATFDLIVQLQGTDAVPAKIPVWIRRVDDPKWRYSPSGDFTAVESLMLSDDQGRVTFAGLASGRYSLDMQGFTPSNAEPGRLVFDIEEVVQPFAIVGTVR